MSEIVWPSLTVDSVFSSHFFHPAPKGPKMKFAEVEKARADAKSAAAKVLDVKNEYLKQRGYEMAVDHVKGRVRWKAPAESGGSQMPRLDAINHAEKQERQARIAAERKIAELKAEHGIGEED